MFVQEKEQLPGPPSPGTQTRSYCGAPFYRLSDPFRDRSGEELPFLTRVLGTQVGSKEKQDSSPTTAVSNYRVLQSLKLKKKKVNQEPIVYTLTSGKRERKTQISLGIWLFRNFIPS